MVEAAYFVELWEWSKSRGGAEHEQDSLKKYQMQKKQNALSDYDSMANMHICYVSIFRNLICNDLSMWLMSLTHRLMHTILNLTRLLLLSRMALKKLKRPNDPRPAPAAPDHDGCGAFLCVAICIYMCYVRVVRGCCLCVWLFVFACGRRLDGALSAPGGCVAGFEWAGYI